jgi:endonuclease YncB( thermonuclease family)
VNAQILAVIALGGVAWLAGCAGAESAPTGPASAGISGGIEGAGTFPESGVVSHVVDGDTVDVDGVGRIRVIGIDTPERGACGYESATQAMSLLVLDQDVTLVPGATDDEDRYGRLLRYVDVGAVDAGLSLIEDGWAIARYDSRDGYGAHPREERYVAADLASPDLGCYPDNEP